MKTPFDIIVAANAYRKASGSVQTTIEDSGFRAVASSERVVIAKDDKPVRVQVNAVGEGTIVSARFDDRNEPIYTIELDKPSGEPNLWAARTCELSYPASDGIPASMSERTARDKVKYIFTPYRETLYKISEALNAAGIPHELHVRHGYATIWAHPYEHAKVYAIAHEIDAKFIEDMVSTDLGKSLSGGT